MRMTRCLQLSLFQEKREAPILPEQRRALVRLVGSLLAEALAGANKSASVVVPQSKEASHEQDHA